MRTNLIIFCCCFLPILTLSATDGGGRDKMHIISYNIWDGFEDEPERKEKFIQWVKEQDPEVMGYQELCKFTEKDLAEMAAQYGHPYVVIAKEEGYPVGLSSKKPIELVTKQIEGYWHGMLHARTYELDFIVIHLSPFEWEFRLKEAEMITSYIREKELTDYMVMGDFNALSPFDADETERKRALRESTSEKKPGDKPNTNMRGQEYDYSVISRFLSTGLTDICRKFVPATERQTCPTATLYKKEWGDPEVLLRSNRIDYILVSPSLVPACINAAIHNGRDADPLSDHYPVSVDIRIN